MASYHLRRKILYRIAKGKQSGRREKEPPGGKTPGVRLYCKLWTYYAYSHILAYPAAKCKCEWRKFPRFRTTSGPEGVGRFPLINRTLFLSMAVLYQNTHSISRGSLEKFIYRKILSQALPLLLDYTPSSGRRYCPV